MAQNRRKNQADKLRIGAIPRESQAETYLLIARRIDSTPIAPKISGTRQIALFESRDKRQPKTKQEKTAPEGEQTDRVLCESQPHFAWKHDSDNGRGRPQVGANQREFRYLSLLVWGEVGEEVGARCRQEQAGAC